MWKTVTRREISEEWLDRERDGIKNGGSFISVLSLITEITADKDKAW